MERERDGQTDRQRDRETGEDLNTNNIITGLSL